MERGNIIRKICKKNMLKLINCLPIEEKLEYLVNFGDTDIINDIFKNTHATKLRTLLYYSSHDDDVMAGYLPQPIDTPPQKNIVETENLGISVENNEPSVENIAKDLATEVVNEIIDNVVEKMSENIENS